jgi:hypothetical protein
MPRRLEAANQQSSDPGNRRLADSLPDGRVPALAGRFRRRSAAAAWIMLAACILLLVGGAWFARERIVGLWPPAAALYSLIGIAVEPPRTVGLALQNLRSSRQLEAGVPVLVVAGDIVNNSDQVRNVPRIKVALRNANRQEIYHWTFTTDDHEIAPEKRVGFTTRLSGPPEEASELLVTFAEDAEPARR